MKLRKINFIFSFYNLHIYKRQSTLAKGTYNYMVKDSSARLNSPTEYYFHVYSYTHNALCGRTNSEYHVGFVCTDFVMYNVRISYIYYT